MTHEIKVRRPQIFALAIALALFSLLVGVDAAYFDLTSYPKYCEFNAIEEYCTQEGYQRLIEYSLNEDFDPLDIRQSAGIGLRYITPVGPLRLDYGFKLDKRTGESLAELHFAVGMF